MLIGVIVPDIAHGFYGRATKAMQDVLEAAGYQILVMNTERRPEREQAAVRSLLAHDVAGILMASSGGVSEAPSVPTVFFDSLEPGLGYANVAQANKDGIDVLVGHLADFHDYRRIAYLGAPPALTSGIERLEGYRDSMGRRALPVPPELIVLSDGTCRPKAARRRCAICSSSPSRPRRSSPPATRWPWARSKPRATTASASRTTWRSCPSTTRSSARSSSRNSPP
jgi:DNA-binding LacI/PurR family transcriptional regulator